MKTLMNILMLASLGLSSFAIQAAEHGNSRNSHGNDRGHEVRHDGGRGRVVVIGRGPRYYAPFNYGVGIGVGVGVGLGYGFYGYPYSSWDYYPPRDVVIQHNTYVEPAPQDADVVTYTNRANETSLLKDLQGRCFERSYDSSGRELRKELDPSACNF